MTEGRGRILISGASGFIGSALVPHLDANGWEVTRLVRRVPRAEREISWDPARGRLDRSALEGFEAVVHLSGESLAAGRWSAQRKQTLWSSRIESTRLLSETLARASHKPRVLISTSAVGYYGDRGSDELDETSRAGEGFLPKLAQLWEAATDGARRAGIRVVHPRFGIVLASHGGALAQLLVPFQLGLGGPIGGGRAWWSWITLDDLMAALEFVVRDESIGGAVNFTAPGAVTQAEFARTLGHVLGRPALFPVPAVVLKAVFGQMAKEALLASARAVPRRLTRAGYVFQFPELETALRHVLRREGLPAS